MNEQPHECVVIAPAMFGNTGTAARREYSPAPRPVAAGGRSAPWGPNTGPTWPAHRLIYEHGFTPEQVRAMTTREVLDANEAIDVMYDVLHPPEEPKAPAAPGRTP